MLPHLDTSFVKILTKHKTYIIGGNGSCNIYGIRVVTFRDFLRPCYSVMVKVFRIIFAAIDCPRRYLHTAKKRIPIFQFFLDFMGL